MPPARVRKRKREGWWRCVPMTTGGSGRKRAKTRKGISERARAGCPGWSGGDGPAIGTETRTGLPGGRPENTDSLFRFTRKRVRRSA
ncbi:hypothetical protein Sgou_46220 [Streptomyces gougerotii]|uniref:Uncharacterized protein n=2 Tax=Streptomyces diastaticus group TaxID=2849069 RepID=A0A8H9HHJ7_9ACTN|nr:hypothetical protein Srut_19910 [Streptomyces rutgersensis]GFH69523.1 hypothetical protein Sdia_02910 [Streptomyces diastaticus subsp. diastaticus]GFH79952.1 hypothetical protein Sgou_46220 [Streptomyces gougerotii]GGU35920.1 hypothetical protein GCM10015534_43040 [Streptomyces diastaticus subsp. diastaticus]GGU63812.1 hypothetical protein GCM10010227_16700 [Streptomyces gougerotii]